MKADSRQMGLFGQPSSTPPAPSESISQSNSASGGAIEPPAGTGRQGYCYHCMREQPEVLEVEYPVKPRTGDIAHAKRTTLCRESMNAMRVEGFKIKEVE